MAQGHISLSCISSSTDKSLWVLKMKRSKNTSFVQEVDFCCSTSQIVIYHILQCTRHFHWVISSNTNVWSTDLLEGEAHKKQRMVSIHAPAAPLYSVRYCRDLPIKPTWICKRTAFQVLTCGVTIPSAPPPKWLHWVMLYHQHISH